MKEIIRFVNKKLFWLVYKFKPTFMFPFPNFVCIEASTHCNLKCACCPTGQAQKGMSKGFLQFEDFKAVIDKCGFFLNRVQLSNYGEIFLNPEIFKIIKYAEDRGIRVCADTNLNYFNESMAEELVKTGMTDLTVAIDGASNESYSKYRVNGNFDRVISNVKSINKFKQKYNSKKPALIWQFVLFGYNEHEIDEARAMAKSLDMRFCIKLNWSRKFFPVAHPNSQSPGVIDNLCGQLWHMPVINYNGNMLGCCVLFDEKYHFGNVFNEGFPRVYNGHRMRTARRMMRNGIKGIDSIYCSQCKSYLQRLKSLCFQG